MHSWDSELLKKVIDVGDKNKYQKWIFNNPNGFYLFLRFKLKRGQLFCARPGDKWVQDLVKHIDKKIQKWKSISAKRR